MIIVVNDEEVTVTTTEEMEEFESASSTDATQSDSVHHFDITEEEIKTVTEFLPKIYNLFVFWFLVWFVLQMLARIKSSFLKSTDRME